MSELEARLLTESEYNQWDQLVEQSKQGTIFHLSKWITTTANSLHLDYAIIGVFKDSQLIGGCSFFIKNKFHIFKIGYTSVPLTFFGGLVMSLPKSTKVRESEQREHTIISSILEKIQTSNFFYLSLINSPDLIDIRPFKKQGWREHVYYTYIVSLENDIFKNLSSKVRTNIRKAQKLGITVKKEYNPDIYWELTKSTFGKQNMKVPYQKKHLFALMEMIRQNNLGEMWIARTPNGEPASADFIIWDNKQAHRWIAASDEQFKDTNATSLLIFEIFLDLQKKGFHDINMMSANMSNLKAFTTAFNPRLVQYYRVERIYGTGKLFELAGIVKEMWTN